MNEDPADYAVELIVKAMPGFESQTAADLARARDDGYREGRAEAIAELAKVVRAKIEDYY